MKKKYIMCVFLIIIVNSLFLFSCSKEPKDISTEIAGEDGEIYKLANNKVSDFYFYYPENFIVDKNAVMISVHAPDATEQKIVINQSENNEENVNAFDYPVNPNLSVFGASLRAEYANVQEYWEKFVEPSLSSAFNEIVLEASEDVNIAGYSGKKYVYTEKLGNLDYKCGQIIIFKGREVYTITYTATPDRYEKYVNVLDKAVETFVFK